MSYRITEKCNGCGACLRLCPAGAISGEKKKPQRIDAALCIACGGCGRVCPQAAVLDGEGIVCRMSKRSEWLKPAFALDACVACGICIDGCPVGCLALSELPRNKGVDAFPFLQDAKACIGCGFCGQECPVEAITMQKPVPL